MLLQSLAIMENYDKEIWDKVLKKLLTRDLSAEFKNEIFGNTLEIAICLFEIDDINKDSETKELIRKVKEIGLFGGNSSRKLSSISRGHKIYINLFNKIGYGYDQVEIEKQVGPLKCDLYIKDLDMVIEIEGPTHFKNKSEERMDSGLYVHKIFKHYHKYLVRIMLQDKERNELISLENDTLEAEEALKTLIQQAIKEQQ